MDELEERQLTDGVALRDLERVSAREPLDQRRRSRCGLHRLRHVGLRDPERACDLPLRAKLRELGHLANVCEPVELRTATEQTRLFGAVFKLSRHADLQVVIPQGISRRRELLSTRIRREALRHALLSFVLGVTVLAAMINLVSALAQ
ncbi:hypothetical protein ACFPRL_36565 [Pseudoclavibacter helvolus]